MEGRWEQWDAGELDEEEGDLDGWGTTCDMSHELSIWIYDTAFVLKKLIFCEGHRFLSGPQGQVSNIRVRAPPIIWRSNVLHLFGSWKVQNRFG